MTESRVIDIKKKILGKNDQMAQDLRDEFARSSVFVANLVSSPGAGKTELLRATMAELRKTHNPAAVTGDLATENDASRLLESGAPAKQILTGTRINRTISEVENAPGLHQQDNIAHSIWG